MSVMSKSGARDWYEDGVADHYREHGSSYRNPHASIIDQCLQIAVARWPLKLGHVLDLAAGAGEFTLALSRATGLPLASSREGERTLPVTACDAFTMRAYADQTGLPCQQITFEQIAAGTLRGHSFSLVGCSFAMHLCPVSQLPVMLLELSQIALQLMILSPHKRPIIREGWGFRLIDAFTEARVHVRLLETTFERLETTFETTTLSREP